jgi:hypothetical protein
MKKLSKSELIDLLKTDISAFNQYRFDTYWCEIDISGTDLRYADLKGANLRIVNLSYSLLNHADLNNADLSGSDLNGADLNGAKLGNADLLGTNLCNAIGLPSNEDYLNRYFAKNSSDDSWTVYITFNHIAHFLPECEKLEHGKIITVPFLNCDRRRECESGIYFATFRFFNIDYKKPKEIWKCKIKLDYYVVMPYNTIGYGRCSKLKLIKKIKQR